MPAEAITESSLMDLGFVLLSWDVGRQEKSYTCHGPEGKYLTVRFKAGSVVEWVENGQEVPAASWPRDLEAVKRVMKIIGVTFSERT